MGRMSQVNSFRFFFIDLHRNNDSLYYTKNNELANGVYYSIGNSQLHFKAGLFHNEKGPAIYWSGGRTSYYINGHKIKEGLTIFHRKRILRLWHSALTD